MIKICKQFGFITLVALLLVACGKETNNNPAENATSIEDQQGADTNTNNNTDSLDTNKNVNLNPPYAFVEFDLEADFDGTVDTVEVDYEYETNKIDASYEDSIQQFRLTGEEAMEKLDGIFSSFNFDENTPNDEVLQTVMQAFHIPDDATKVELDVEFTNGTEKEYRK